MDPIKIFNREIEELEVFYNIATLSFDEVEENSILNKLNQSNVELFESLKSSKIYAEQKNTFVGYQKYFLRELIFIRLISALEVYLIDNIKYIFLLYKEPFKTNSRIEFSQEQLLSITSTTDLFEKIINKECRQLSSGGFEKICSYYLSKLAIDLGSIEPGKKTMEEYHDRRHLFVHRLGNTDAHYRKKYNVSKRGLSITKTYLEVALRNFKIFANEVSLSTQKVLNKNQNIDFKTIERSISFSFKYENDLPDFSKPEFHFWSNDYLISLKDILKEIKLLENNTIEIYIEGSYEKVTSYYRNAKHRIKRKNGLSEFKLLKINDYKEKPAPSPKAKKRKLSFSFSDLEAVLNVLPEKPWAVGIHKEIAQKLNFSSAKVYGIISYLENSKKTS